MRARTQSLSLLSWRRHLHGGQYQSQHPPRGEQPRRVHLRRGRRRHTPLARGQCQRGGLPCRRGGAQNGATTNQCYYYSVTDPAQV